MLSLRTLRYFLLLNVREEHEHLFITWIITSFGVRIKLYFPLKSPLIFSRSVLTSFRDSFILRTCEKRDAKISHIDINPSYKSFMSIRSKSGSNTDPWGTPESFDFHSKVWQFKLLFVHDLQDNLLMDVIIKFQHQLWK